MADPYVFKAWCGKDETATKGGMVFEAFTPKPWDDDDIDVKIIYSGICGSDFHALSGEWGPLSAERPAICGHEIVGEVVKVGTTVTNVALGDKVGIGAQSDSCRTCDYCMSGDGNLCARITWTMSSPYQHGNAGAALYHSKGGFAKFWRGPSGYAIRIPPELDLASAAPMFCGGVTAYTPLEEFGVGTKVKRVGVIGIGGVGHYAIMFAKAMGAHVTAISRAHDKAALAKSLGADEYLAMSDADGRHDRTLELIVCTMNPDDLDLRPYMPLLVPRGYLCIVGISPKLSLACHSLIGGNKRVAGSNIGSPDQIKRMLQLAVDHNLQSWINKYNMDDINQALIDFRAGKPRFRFVLVNTDNGGTV